MNKELDKMIEEKQKQCLGKHGRHIKIYLLWARYDSTAVPLITLRAITSFKEKAELYELLIMRDEKNKPTDMWIEERIMNHSYGAIMMVGKRLPISP